MNICSSAPDLPLVKLESLNFKEWSLIFKEKWLKFKDWSSKIKPFIWNSKIVQNLSFHFQTEVLEFQQFNFEIQNIKLKFQTFLFKFYGLKFQRLIIKFEIQRKSFFKFQTLFLLLNFTRKD